MRGTLQNMASRPHAHPTPTVVCCACVLVFCVLRAARTCVHALRPSARLISFHVVAGAHARARCHRRHNSKTSKLNADHNILLLSLLVQTDMKMRHRKKLQTQTHELRRAHKKKECSAVCCAQTTANGRRRQLRAARSCLRSVVRNGGRA